jgi:hypothetical protein
MSRNNKKIIQWKSFTQTKNLTSYTAKGKIKYQTIQASEYSTVTLQITCITWTTDDFILYITVLIMLVTVWNTEKLYSFLILPDDKATFL